MNGATDSFLRRSGGRPRQHGLPHPRDRQFILGTRPAGVHTAGQVRFFTSINMEGYLPGKRAVILGSGDIGMIMAVRMTLEGISVLGVYEVMPAPGGLTHIVQCLNDYDIPLHLEIHNGRAGTAKGVEGVTVARVDESVRKPVLERKSGSTATCSCSRWG